MLERRYRLPVAIIVLNNGGLVDPAVDAIEISTTPRSIPDEFVIDVSEMTMDSVIRLGDVPMPAARPAFGRAVEVRTQAAAPVKIERHVYIASERAAEWRRMFAEQGGPETVIVDDAPGAATSLIVLIPVRAVTSGWPPPGWVFVACDIGQGDALVLKAGPHAAVEIDAIIAVR